MANVTHAHLVELGAERKGPCLSIFMPAEGAGPDVQQDRIRLEGLIKKGQEILVARGIRRTEAEALTATALREAAETRDWKPRGRGLAVYLAPDHYEALRVDASMPETVFAGPRFLIRPVLQALYKESPFYVLALSRGDSALYLADSITMQEVEVPSMPPSVEAVSQFEDPEKQVQTRSATGARVVAGGGRTGQVVHGHGEANDGRSDTFSAYLRLVADTVGAYVKPSNLPVVLISPEEVASAFRRHAVSLLAEEGISGAPDRLSKEFMHGKAREIVLRAHAAEKAAAAERLADSTERGRVMVGFDDVVSAAMYGRVMDLFVAQDASATGRYHAETGKTSPAPADDLQSDDLLDLACVHALKNGGRVFPVPQIEMPSVAGPQPLAALLRY